MTALAIEQGTKAAVNCSPDPAAMTDSEKPGTLSVGKDAEKLESLALMTHSVNCTTIMRTIWKMAFVAQYLKVCKESS